MARAGRLFVGLLLGLLVLGAVAVAGAWLLLPPRLDREWRADYARQPTVERAGDAYLLRNIRDWSYAPDGTATAETWIDQRLDPSELVRLWFVMEPFGGTPAIAHTMVAFEFADGSAYVASVEARRETGDTEFRPLLAALWPIYEYAMIWTTERDMYANTVFLAKDQLYLYPLTLPAGWGPRILTAFLDRTAELAAEPAWYNTLFANCTNVLARIVNGISPGAIPLDVAWFLPGYADSFLHGLGYIVAPGGFDAAERAADLTPLVPGVLASAPPERFSQALRAARRAVP